MYYPDGSKEVAEWKDDFKSRVIQERSSTNRDVNQWQEEYKAKILDEKGFNKYQVISRYYEDSLYM